MSLSVTAARIKAIAGRGARADLVAVIVRAGRSAVYSTTAHRYVFGILRSAV
ncbi:MAG: hypothetical protein JWR80_5118 [Bradyrhizobium sp.]|nr:hypothetical protein [Bradyrhizobium sp.]